MSKSLIRRRREASAVCPVCHSPDYEMLPPAFEGGKPNFQCNQCEHGWQCGYDGEDYARLAKEETWKNKKLHR